MLVHLEREVKGCASWYAAVFQAKRELSWQPFCLASIGSTPSRTDLRAAEAFSRIFCAATSLGRCFIVPATAKHARRRARTSLYAKL